MLKDAALSSRTADVYFASVLENPVDPRTLLGLFPTVVRLDDGEDGAALLVAVTCDGRHFAHPTPIFNSSHVGGEIVDHVVDGVSVDGDDYLFFAHAGVPGTLEKVCAYKHLHPKPGTKPPHHLDRKPPWPADWAPPKSQILALAVSRGRLRSLTRAGVNALQAKKLCRNH